MMWKCHVPKIKRGGSTCVFIWQQLHSRACEENLLLSLSLYIELEATFLSSFLCPCGIADAHTAANVASLQAIIQYIVVCYSDTSVV